MSVWKEKISSYFEDKTEVLIVGGTGTLGKALLSLIGNHKKYRVTVLSREELKQKQLMDLYPDVRFVLGDIRDADSLGIHFLGKEAVFHFAAMKHVDMAEHNPEESIKINLLGSLNVAKAAVNAGVRHCVFSSTDKAVLPINNYGMCKALSENYFLTQNTIQDITKFSVFRWGNVLGSRGSVIHGFLSSLKESKTVRITDARMTRFWIDIRDCAKYILEHYDSAEKYSAMIPPMKSCRIVKIAELCARYLGINDYKIEYTGIRAGEKIHETIFSSHEVCYRSDTTEEYSDDELLEMISGVA